MSDGFLIQSIWSRSESWAGPRGMNTICQHLLETCAGKAGWLCSNNNKPLPSPEIHISSSPPNLNPSPTSVNSVGLCPGRGRIVPNSPTPPAPYSSSTEFSQVALHLQYLGFFFGKHHVPFLICRLMFLLFAEKTEALLIGKSGAPLTVPITAGYG